MPYNAIDPFREAVVRTVQRQRGLGIKQNEFPTNAARDAYADDNPDWLFAYNYYRTFWIRVGGAGGVIQHRNAVGNAWEDVTEDGTDWDPSTWEPSPGIIGNWSTTEVLDYQGGGASNPEGQVGPGEKFVSVTQLPDGAMGHFFYGRPDGLLRVTMQMDVWQDWRLGAEALADAVARAIDGRVAPGLSLGTIQSGVRSTAFDPSLIKWRVSQRFAITAYDEG